MSAKMSPIAAYYPKPERKRTDIITYQDLTYSQGKIKHGRQLLKKEKNYVGYHTIWLLQEWKKQ